MGSPNFYTGNEALQNFGIDFDSTDDENIFWACDRDQVGEELDAANDQLTFFKLIEKPGYHSGLQVYLIQLNSAEYYWENYAKYWHEENDYGFYSDQGYWVYVSLHEKYLNLIENNKFTDNHLKEIMAAELEVATKLIKQIAQTHSLGEVTGKGFTSSINYGWFEA